MSRRLWWCLVAVVAAVATLFGLHPERFRALGVNFYGVWFLDTFALLASSDAHARGLDPYVTNALDYFGRPHGYPHWWLRLHDLGLARGDYLWLGCLLAAAFFVAAIAGLRPKTWGQLGIALLVICSPPVLLATNRGNNDLLVFVLLAPVAFCLTAKHPAFDALAVGLIAVAALLKVYPLVAAAALFIGRTPEVRRRLLLFGVFGAAMALDLFFDLPRYARIIPKPDGLMSFSALNIFEAAGVSSPQASVLSWVAGGMVGVVFWQSGLLKSWDQVEKREPAWPAFVLGASLLTGCFFAGASFAYRWIFCLWLLPWLWAVAWESGTPLRIRRFAIVTLGLLVFVVWSDALASMAILRFVHGQPENAVATWAKRLFVAEQPIVWAFFACLIGWLLPFLAAGVRAALGREEAA